MSWKLPVKSALFCSINPLKLSMFYRAQRHKGEWCHLQICYSHPVASNHPKASQWFRPVQVWHAHYPNFLWLVSLFHDTDNPFTPPTPHQVGALLYHPGHNFLRRSRGHWSPHPGIRLETGRACNVSASGGCPTLSSSSIRTRS